MRILHTNFLRGWGGQSNRVLAEAAGVAALGHEVLVSAPPGSELAKRSRARGLAVTEKVAYAGGARLAVLGDVSEMRRLLREFRPDILHLHGGRDSWVAAAALAVRPPWRPRVIRTKHNVFPIGDHAPNRWQYGAFFERIVCLSRAIIEQCAEKPYIAREKLDLIPSAVDCGRFDAERGKRESLRREFGLGEDDLAIAMTGRLRPEKGHDVLLAAAPGIVRRFPNAKFLLIGSGSMHGELERELEERGLGRHVILTGFRNDVPACLAAADIYAQPSRSEGLGTSVLEACAARLPVVASEVGGIPDVIENGVSGLLVEVGNGAALEAGIARLLESAQLRQQLAAGGREKVERVFSLGALVEKTAALYASLAPPR